MDHQPSTIDPSARLAVLCQEEPVFLGPFLCGVIRMRPEQIAAVFIAGRRGAGEKQGSMATHLGSLRIFWHIMEPHGFFAGLVLRRRAALLGARDPRSVAGTARKLGIPVHAVGNPNKPEFHALLKETGPDLVLNQSERLLKKEVLAIPRLGFINRHASLLPRARGRMAAFWSHAAEEPRYGLTIHFVDEGVDTGDIILQKEFADVDPAWPYPRVMRRIMANAPALLWEAVDLLGRADFEPRPQTPVDKPHVFPTLEEARAYRRRLRRRRASK
ncbi:MAG: hypothetical protein JXR37_00805 [Kiritimatiellae bacterium]|nr:hypothetical protein [Kiritimatiellia bacterium]